MIQRIQSIFFVLAAAVMGLMFKYPIVKFLGEENVFYSISKMKAEGGTEFPLAGKYILLGLVISVIVLLIAAFFSFKNRNLQMNINKFIMFLLMGVIASLFFFIDANQANLTDAYTPGYGIAYFCPMIALVFSYLALHFTKKDEKLVKSVDRLR